MEGDNCKLSSKILKKKKPVIKTILIKKLNGAVKI